MTKTIAVVSGGLDSVTMAYDLFAKGHDIEIISFNYGQRHVKELAFAAVIASTLKVKHDIVDLTSLTQFISNSALTSHATFDNTGGLVSGDPDESVEVPEGHYAEENMKATVVPNRNMIMLAIAAGIAVNRKADTIATAVHAGDHFVYPDCRPQFIMALGEAIQLGNEGFAYFEAPVTTPFIFKTKADIAQRALELGVPLHMTWSCYKGGDNHCGRCGTCVERLEAIDEAQHRFTWMNGVIPHHLRDFTVYDDPDFWRGAIASSKKVEEVHDSKDYS